MILGVDSLQVDRRRAEVGGAELALDDVERDALAGEPEPALAASAARRQAVHVEELAQLLATRMGVDAADDLRPRLAISAAFAALNAAW